MNETMCCPMCEADRACRRQIVREEYEVRGEKISLDVPRLFCAACGESVIDPAFGDPTLKLYAEYRARHNLLDSVEPDSARHPASPPPPAGASTRPRSPAP